jgi:hypothetical protein
MDLKESREFRRNKNTSEAGTFRYPLCKATSLRYGHHNPVTEGNKRNIRNYAIDFSNYLLRLCRVR